MSSVASVHAVNRWATKIIPAILAGCVGFSTYVVTKRICVDYFIDGKDRPATAIPLLVFHCIFLLFVVWTYTRLLLVIVYNPGVVPRGETSTPTKKSRRRKSRHNDHDIEAQFSGGRPDSDPNSPGLERFYSKDVFICQNDGLPRYCSSCRAWKPDRTHHSSEINRCVRKMDHYCPWVGGIISETSFKFFVQFVFYNTLYCIVCLLASVLCLHDQMQSGEPTDSLVIAVIALAAFFGLFTCGMTSVSLRYIFLNLTNVDVLRQRSTVHQLAIRVPLGTEPGPQYNLIIYPLPEPALNPNSQSSSSQSGPSALRDSLASRTFAVVRTQLGENPWDLGVYRNFVSIMGTNLFDWLLPIRESPCVSYENNESFYEMGPLYDELRTRYSLPRVSDNRREEVTEMRELSGAARR